MKTAERGSYVKLHYKVRFDSGEVVGSSKRNSPLAFTIGKGKVLKKLEQGIIGMQVDETRRIEIPPEEGFGFRDNSLVLKLKKEDLPTQKDIAVGRTVQFMNESGGMVNLIITAVGDDYVIVDANHPFAGRTVIYEVVLLSVLPYRP